MAERKTYRGGCQCGAVTFEADLAIDGAIACNCSRCRRLGSLLAFAPATDFRLLTGETALTEYLFHKHRIHHLFCATCGIQSFGRAAGPDGQEMVAVNIRCLDGVDLDAVPVRHYDGASL